MSKHKIIHKIFQHPHPRQTDQNSDSSDEEPYQLQQVNYNNQFNQPKQSSILDFIDSLKYYSQEEISEEEQHHHDYTVCNSMSLTAFSDLEKINARYMAIIGNFQPSDQADVPVKYSKVKFDGQVRAKYFSSEGTVAQIFDAEQYTSYEQLQQTQDERHELSPN